MNFNSAFPRITVMLAMATMLVRIPLAAAAGLPSQTYRDGSQVAVRDLELGRQGTLKGQIVTAQGVAAGGKAVAVYAAGQQIAAATTAADGTFAFDGLRGGSYQIVANGSVADCRLWVAGSAPPNAQQSILIVAPTTQVRGQDDGGLNPWPTIAGIGLFAGITVGVVELLSDNNTGS